MKLPSIINIPSYEKFNYEPRFYDPIKEDIDGRRQRIKRRIDADKKRGTFKPGARLEGAFTRRPHFEDKSSFTRLIVGVVLFCGVVGFLYFGNIAVYITTAVVIGYIAVKKFFIR